MYKIPIYKGRFSKLAEPPEPVEDPFELVVVAPAEPVLPTTCVALLLRKLFA